MDLPIWNTILRRKQDSVKEIFEFLKKNSLFESMKKKEIWEVSRLIHRRSYAPGEIIFRQGQVGAGLFLIMNGSVNIYSDQENVRVQLAHLSTGAFFGELSLFSDVPRSATAIAKEDSILLGFFQPELETLIHTKPRIGTSIVLSLTRLITKRLIDTNKLLENAYIKGKKKKGEID